MNESTPVLYIFAISHYCEKARWALDALGVDYELRHVAPGEHIEIAKKLGAPRSSVPYLSLDGQVIQGSADIISWAEKVSSSDTSLTPDAEACEQIEKRIDDIAGVHVRRFYYSEALVEHPSTIRPIFTRDLPLMKKLMICLGWGKIRKIMISRMDLGAQQGEESKNILNDELNWIDELLADGRSYLVGDRFSRADIAVASILAPLALPSAHPVYSRLEHPPRMAQELSDWESRRSFKWVHDVYKKHR
jgi:glutathione S-transferase